MSFWRTVKRGFGYGFGGRLGWEAGGLVWGWIMKVIGWIVLVVGAGVGLPMVAGSVGKYQEVKQRIEQQQQHQAPGEKAGKGVVDAAHR